jgi:hypothetical protein
LDDVFQLAIQIAENSALLEPLRQLKSFCGQMAIFDIRNAVAHPNREFPEFYWHRMAAIATDPLIFRLGMTQLYEEFRKADQGIIDAPPEEWMLGPAWTIKHTLPDRFSHSITGLIGRRQEQNALIKLLQNPRVNLIAVVAPGGFGKTALALETLNSYIHDPSSFDNLDAVLFVSLKREKLTPEGVIELDAAGTIEELKSEILEQVANLFADPTLNEFSGITDRHGHRKIVLCVDNLETLLRDNAESFDEFHLNLPVSWRVLVTSRVAITNAAIVTLPPLSNDSAVGLSRAYASRIGIEGLSAESFRDICRRCHQNPLAIRLTLDLIGTGKELPDAIDWVNKEVTTFSFENLINALSDTAVMVLECMFVRNEVSRLEVCDLLGLSVESAAESFGQLTRTSLVVRDIDENGDETFSLNTSVRDVLRVSPRNIETREIVSAKIRRQADVGREIQDRQEQLGLSRFDFDYVDPDLPATLREMLVKASRAIGSSRRRNKSQSASSILAPYVKSFSEVEARYTAYSAFHRTFAQMLSILKDSSGAEKQFSLALDIEPGDVLTRVCLARHHFDYHQFDKAEVIYKKLYDEGWHIPENSTIKFAGIVYRGYLLTLLFANKTDDVLDLTKKWKDSTNFRKMLGAYRASAQKRIGEKINRVSADRRN